MKFSFELSNVLLDIRSLLISNVNIDHECNDLFDVLILLTACNNAAKEASDNDISQMFYGYKSMVLDILYREYPSICFYDHGEQCVYMYYRHIQFSFHDLGLGLKSLKDRPQMFSGLHLQPLIFGVIDNVRILRRFKIASYTGNFEML